MFRKNKSTSIYERQAEAYVTALVQLEMGRLNERDDQRQERLQRECCARRKGLDWRKQQQSSQLLPDKSGSL